jgi:hypothetical protein
MIRLQKYWSDIRTLPPIPPALGLYLLLLVPRMPLLGREWGRLDSGASRGN